MTHKQDILSILQTLELDAVPMQRIMMLIDGVVGADLDDETVRDIKTILLEEEEKALDAAAFELGVDTANDPAVLALDREYDEEVASIKSEFDADMIELDLQLGQLMQAQVTLSEADDAAQIAVLTKTLTAS